MKLAILETRNFEFFGTGFSESQAVDGLKEAWFNHCNITPDADVDYGTNLINEGEFRLYDTFSPDTTLRVTRETQTRVDHIPLNIKVFDKRATPTDKTQAISATLSSLEDVVSHAKQVTAAFRAFQDGTLKMGQLADLLEELGEAVDVAVG